MPSLQAAIIDGYDQGVLLALANDREQAKHDITIPDETEYSVDKPISVGDRVMFKRGRQQVVDAAVIHYSYKNFLVHKLDDPGKNPNYRTSTFENHRYRNEVICNVWLEGISEHKFKPTDLAPAIDMSPLHAALEWKMSPEVIRLLVQVHPAAAAESRNGTLPLFVALRQAHSADTIRLLLDAHPVRFEECSAAEIELLGVWCSIVARTSRGMHGKLTADLLKHVTRRADSHTPSGHTGYRRY